MSSHMTWLSFPKVKAGSDGGCWGRRLRIQICKFSTNFQTRSDEVEAAQHTSLNQLETKHAEFDGSQAGVFQRMRTAEESHLIAALAAGGQERAPLEEQLVGADLASLL